MDTLFRDFRFAIRSLAKHRAMAIVATLCLALGIGSTTAIFSVVHGVLLGSLPYREPDGLVRLYEVATRGGSTTERSVSAPNYLDWRAQSRAFTDVAAYTSANYNLTGTGDPTRISAAVVTGNLFPLLGASPILGRALGPADENASAAPVVMISERFWRRQWSGDPRALGATLSLDGTPYTIVGVMPAAFDFPVSSNHMDAWTPLVFANRSDARSRSSYWLAVVARLRPGVSMPDAVADMNSVMDRLNAAYPTETKGVRTSIHALDETIVGPVRTALLTMLAAVGLVLMIACANVASLLLARSEGRRREVAIRTALGADRSRLIRQLLTESAVLGLAGGLLGIVIATIGMRSIVRFLATALPRADLIRIDGSVLGFAILVSLATSLIFGLVPAIRATATDLRRDLGEGAGRTGAGRRQRRSLQSLVIVEIALSFVLVVGAGLLIRSFVALLSTNPGVSVQNILTFQTTLSGAKFSTPNSYGSARYSQFYGPMLEGLRSIPGVKSVGMTNQLPLRGWEMNGNFTIVGRPVSSSVVDAPFAEFRIVSDDYFRTLGIGVVAGREFSHGDDIRSPRVMLVNDEFARKYFPSGNVLGQQILPWDTIPSTIVGVVASVHEAGLDHGLKPEVYVPAAQAPWRLYGMTVAVATTVSPQLVADRIRSAVHAVSADQPIYNIRTMEGVLSDSLSSRRLTLTLLAIFGGLALLLASAGILGVISYTVSQRTREIGIRMALGARNTDIGSMIIGEAGRLVGLGLAVGAVLAIAASSAMHSLVYGIGARDPLTFVAVSLVICVVAVGSAVVPAVRAARADPLLSMRAE